MIAGIRGTLEAKTLDSAFITVGGVTLRVFAPLSVLSAYNTGEEVALPDISARPRRRAGALWLQDRRGP